MSFQRASMYATRAIMPRMITSSMVRSTGFQMQPIMKSMAHRMTIRAFSQVRPLLDAATTTSSSSPSTSSSSSSTSSSSSSTSSQKNVPTDVVVAEPSSFSQVVQKYGGWYPFLGLAGVIAVSKEVVIMNEEFLLVSNFAVVFAALYFAFGDAITKAAEEERIAYHKKLDEMSDFEIAVIENNIISHKANVGTVEVLKNLKNEFNTVSTDLVKAKSLKLRLAARDAVVKRLSDLKSREASERASFKEVVGSKATAYVRRQFAASPANVKASLIDFAIDVVEGKKKALDAKSDPIKKLYADYFNNKVYVQEIEAEKKQKQ